MTCKLLVLYITTFRNAPAQGSQTAVMIVD